MASTWCAAQTDGLPGIARINDSGVRILHSARALRKVAVGKANDHDAWVLALIIGLVAALIVAGLLLGAHPGRTQHRGQRVQPARDRRQGGRDTSNIPQLQATAPALALIVDEAVVQDGYMNALTDGYGGK